MAEQSNSNNSPDWFIILFLVLAMGAGFWIGFELGKHRTRIAAVRASVAEFYLPERESQTSEFRWKTNSIVVTNTVPVFILRSTSRD